MPFCSLRLHNLFRCIGYGTPPGLGRTLIPSEHPGTTLQRVPNSVPLTLLALDIFETPWYPEASPSTVEDLLAAIGSGKRSSLVTTMRGSALPSVLT